MFRGVQCLLTTPVVALVELVELVVVEGEEPGRREPDGQIQAAGAELPKLPVAVRVAEVVVVLRLCFAEHRLRFGSVRFGSEGIPFLGDLLSGGIGELVYG